MNMNRPRIISSIPRDFYHAKADTRQQDDLGREVYGVLGMPIDLVDMRAVLERINEASAARGRFFLSTPNMNFLATSRTDPEFRESLLVSDLCPPDGIAIIWLARLLGIPLKERIAGADIFEGLKSACCGARRLSVFLFGGNKGVGAAACAKLNAGAGGATCVGYYDPGFRTVDEMSSDQIIQMINASGADLLVVALGAKKGQAWLLRNHDRLQAPVRVHLGAVINFQAGAVKRAPVSIRKLGLEWLWRIWQEPYLWRRYASDFIVLIRLMLKQVIPLILIARWSRIAGSGEMAPLELSQCEDGNFVVLNIKGAAVAQNAERMRSCFRDLVSRNKNVAINFEDTSRIDARFLGLLLMLNQELKKQGLYLMFGQVSAPVKRFFRLSGFEFLLRTNIESVA